MLQRGPLNVINCTTFCRESEACFPTDWDRYRRTFQIQENIPETGEHSRYRRTFQKQENIPATAIRLYNKSPLARSSSKLTSINLSLYIVNEVLHTVALNTTQCTF